MKKIPFTITIRQKQYTGELQTNDQSEPPKVFFVFIDSYIVGNLLCSNKWKFEQVGEGVRLDKLTETEKQAIAEYLGNIAVEDYE